MVVVMRVVAMAGMVVLPLMMAIRLVMMPLVMPVMVMVPVMMAMCHRRLFRYGHRLQLLRFLGCRCSD